MARRTRKQITEQRIREWAFMVTHWYAGNRTCVRCGRFTYCSGRSYDRQRCRSCFIEHGTNGKSKTKHHNHNQEVAA